MVDGLAVRLRLATLILAAQMADVERQAQAQSPPAAVDLALVLAVDVSGSIDSSRFTLQMEGIAKAFEDPEVQRVILGGRHAAIAVTLVNWSNKPIVAAPWTRIASQADAHAFAGRVRQAPRTAADFTCLSAMMQTVGDRILPLLPMAADRLVVDVSGDGSDNCNPRTTVDSARSSLVEAGVTINGLPILDGREAATIAGWYDAHVVGGPSAFIEPAYGYEDFARAIRQKFVAEISFAPAARPLLAQARPLRDDAARASRPDAPIQ